MDDQNEMRPRRPRMTGWIGSFLVLALASEAGFAAAGPTIRAKSDAPADLAEIIAQQDDVASRLPHEGLALRSRLLAPRAGVDPRLERGTISSAEPALVIAAFDRFPTPDDWRTWADDGSHRVEYLGNRHWLMRLTTEAAAAFAQVGARAFAPYEARDKIDPALDGATDLVVVDVYLDDVTTERRQALRTTFHHDGRTFVDRTSETIVTLVMSAADLVRLAEAQDVIAIDGGLWEDELLLDGVRARVHGDTVESTDDFVLTGKDIRMANCEVMDAGSDHLDLFRDDTFALEPRFTQVAIDKCTRLPLPEGSCLFSVNSASLKGHALLTAGIMLGNGRQSVANGGASRAFRGIAPNATYECYFQTGARAHVSSHSYVGPDYLWDQSVVHDLTDERFHAHVVAAGNDGLIAGYRSLRNDPKNAMVVGNAQVNGQIHPTSSAGPSHRGQIKPDISAPTRNYRRVGDHLLPGFSLEIEWIMLTRNDAILYKWAFDGQTPSWHEGWGQATPLGSMGQVFLDATQTMGGNLRVDVQPEPWGEAWTRTPLIGTQVVPYSHATGGGDPLDFIGRKGDVLSIRYRAVGPYPPNGPHLAYFEMSPIWFRSFPPGATGDVGWHSQGIRGALGIGDGTWRTLDVPVGQAGPSFINGNPYWDDVQSWAAEPIQYLGLRFRNVDIQPTTSFPQNYTASGGTSGASPVVAGAYALAMEHFVRLYPTTELDDKLANSAVHLVPPGPGVRPGMPDNATWKATFVHTARDMIRLTAPGMPPNPDTGIPNVYHAGPDYTTGYGMLNIQAGIDLLTRVANHEPNHDLLEFDMNPGEVHTYEMVIDDATVAGSTGFKVTLVWDDEPAILGDLVNNLGLVVQDPDGNKYHPWSLDVPTLPITASDIVPAKRSGPNDRDNIEQVRIDDLPDDQGGTWRIHVVDNGMGGTGPQPYSLVISPWQDLASCIACK